MTLTLIRTEQVCEEERRRLAWTEVANGFRRALELLNPGEEDYERMKRCLVKSACQAGVSPFGVVKGSDS
jgi:hypothetical protein